MRLILAIVVPYLLAACSLPLLVRKGRAGQLALITLCLPIALSPCLIPLDKPLPRFLAAVNAAVLAVKLVDIRREVSRGNRPDWRVFVAFLGNPFVHVRRCLAREPQPSVRTNFLSLAGGSLGFVAGVTLLGALCQVDWDGRPFLAEHVSKVIAFFLAVCSALTGAAAAWRLLGGTARDYMANPLVARTPADFWRRYNRNMHQFFLEDVFVPAGGLRRPVCASLLVFSLSAMIHEYLFGIAIGRVQGYQTAFFMLQGVAVAATARVKPRGWRAAPWAVGTLGFNLVSGVLFFASLNNLVPFYSHALPAWLLWPGTAITQENIASTGDDRRNPGEHALKMRCSRGWGEGDQAIDDALSARANITSSMGADQSRDREGALRSSAWTVAALTLVDALAALPHGRGSDQVKLCTRPSTEVTHRTAETMRKFRMHETRASQAMALAPRLFLSRRRRCHSYGNYSGRPRLTRKPGRTSKSAHRAYCASRSAPHHGQ